MFVFLLEMLHCVENIPLLIRVRLNINKAVCGECFSWLKPFIWAQTETSASCIRGNEERSFLFYCFGSRDVQMDDFQAKNGIVFLFCFLHCCFGGISC